MLDWTSRLFRPRDLNDPELEALDPDLEDELLSVGVDDESRLRTPKPGARHHAVLRFRHDQFRRQSQRRPRRQVARP